MNEVAWGILGGGKVVEEKSGPAFAIPGLSNIRAVCRRDVSMAARSAKALGATAWYSSLSDMLSDGGVDAVYIATPPGLHYSQAVQCLEAGVPVYLEKPMVTRGDDARNLAALSSNSGVPVFVAHYRRALTKFLMLRSLLPELGHIVDFSLRLERRLEDDAAHPWMYDRSLSGGGKAFDIGAHSLDLLLFFFGSIDDYSVQAKHWEAPNGTEDCVTWNFRFASGVIGTANFNFLSGRKLDRLRIYGSEADLELAIHGSDPSVLTGRDGRQTIVDEAPPLFIEGPMIEQVARSIRGEAANVCLAKDGIVVVDLLEAVNRVLR